MLIFGWGIESKMLQLISGIESALIKPVFDASKGIVAPLVVNKWDYSNQWIAGSMWFKPGCFLEQETIYSHCIVLVYVLGTDPMAFSNLM
jgi:hypothetical protein